MGKLQLAIGGIVSLAVFLMGTLMTVSPEESVKNIRKWIHYLIGWDIPQFSPENTKLVVRAAGAFLIVLIVIGWAIELRPEAHKPMVTQGQKIAPSGKILAHQIKPDSQGTGLARPAIAPKQKPAAPNKIERKEPDRAALPPISAPGGIVTMGQNGGTNIVNNYGPPSPRLTYKKNKIKLDSMHGIRLEIHSDIDVERLSLKAECNEAIATPFPKWLKMEFSDGAAQQRSMSIGEKSFTFTVDQPVPSLTATRFLILDIYSKNDIDCTLTRL